MERKVPREVPATKSRRNLTLMRRIYLFVVAFGVALCTLLGVYYYQEKYVMEPLERQTSNIYAISRFLNSIESSLTLMESYRWDYGDAEALVKGIEQQKKNAASYLQSIEKDLNTVGEEQYLLARAVSTTYLTFSQSMDAVEEDLKAGYVTLASTRYYEKAQPCGTYLQQYTRQLLEAAIYQNQNDYLHTITLQQQLHNLQILVVCTCVILAAVLIVLMRRLLGPVQEMALASQQIAGGNLDVPDIIAPQEDEIGRMAASFNEMKHSMKNRVQLLNEKNEMQQALHRRETETLEMQALVEREKLQQLRSQINPHFLFNTLNVIQYTAGQEKAYRTQSLLTSLSKLFRYSLGSNEEKVPLSNEIRIVDSLFLLYHVRFGDRIRMEWGIPDDIDLTETMVPSFLLQPLVENAFHHGLSPKEEGGLVRIEFEYRGDRLIIRVCDDGVGMDAKTLAAVRQRLETPPTNGEHIGLYNVAARLRLQADGSQMKIDSRPGVGTQVELDLPLIIREETEEEKENPNAENPDCG